MEWKFDDTIANDFRNHAIQHIPNYDTVIQKSISIAESYGKNARIIDVGCAIGETLDRLDLAGFKNIIGVDNSASMLKKCKEKHELVLSDFLPTGKYDLVIINWTLHFIKNKTEYLSDVYKNLNQGGGLILSEKVSLDPFLIKMYHNFKRASGVTEDVIKQKEEMLKNTMHINNAQWYIDTLVRIGFTDISIIDAHWCFNTFYCKK